jgi:hypothetical protein
MMERFLIILQRQVIEDVLYLNMHIYMYIHIYVYMHIDIYVCRYAYMHICVNINDGKVPDYPHVANNRRCIIS